jgi:hypothetical protein
VEYGERARSKIREFFERIAPLNRGRDYQTHVHRGRRNDPRVAHEGEQMAAAIATARRSCT